MRHRYWIIALLLFSLIGCSQEGRDPNLATFKPNANPDELALIVYNKIEKPENLSEITPPKTNVNSVEPNPKADALAAFGGREPRRNRSIPDTDNTMLTHISRLGINPEIRGVLASEDLEFRNNVRGRPLEVLAKVNLYYKAYEPYSLDPELEVIRLREAGIVQ